IALISNLSLCLSISNLTMSDRKKRKSNHNNDNKNQRRRFSNANAETINKEDLVIYRILCPVGIIGGVIGKSGKVINANGDTTKAKIKVFDQSPGCTQRVITIYSSSAAGGEKNGNKNEECRLLVPSSQASGVIGKAGAVIKSIRRRTGASVEISGEHESVKKALYAVSATIAGVVPSFVNASEFQGYAETTSPVSHGFGGSPGSKELVLKVLCPVSSIGRVIGREGSTINGMREASGSRIEVNKANHGDDECVIIVTATESPDDMKSMAVEAILLLQEKISDDIDEETVKMQLLVPSKVIGCIIGKSGSVINQIRKRTNASIRISKGNNDDLVEVSGEVSSVRDALIQIVLRLREDVLGDRGSVSARNPPAARSDHSGFTLAPFVSSVPEYASVDFDQRRETGESSLGMVSSDRFYGYESSFPATDHGLVSVGPYSYGGLYQSSALEILVPASAVSKVIGKGGGNLENIRRISGAMVEFSDSKTSHGDRIALVSGTPEQMRSAENLFQAFIMST
ncbi:hypothetical protein HID58_041045, partial [Brassica napus]